MSVNFLAICNPYCWPHKSKPMRLAATRTDNYQEMLDGIRQHVQMMEKGGFDGVLFTEQHGNLEGVHEVTNNPIMLDMFAASHTQSIKVGQLGIALPVSNPLRVAEDIANLDQMTKGRAIAGFTRGNTVRWANQFGQLNGMTASKSDKSAEDERNLRAFKEAWEIIRLAWTEDTFAYEGEFWSYPVKGTKYPYPAAKKWGPAVDHDDNLIGVGVVPRPYQKPYPRVFSPVSGRTIMVRTWAEAGNSIVSLAASDDFNDHISRMYVEEAQKAGRSAELGDGIILGGCLVMSNDSGKAQEYKRAYLDWYQAYYCCPPYNLPSGRLWEGSSQQVVDHIGEQITRQNVKEFVVLDHVGAPHGNQAGLEMLQLFAEEVIPAFQS